MIALAGSGRQAAALKVYDDIVRRLEDQLGVRPGAQLKDALSRVLRQEFVTTATPAASKPLSEPVVPRQLPAAVPGFVGREHELRRLSRLLNDVPGPVGTVVAIGGTAGVGKTALALHWAHQIAGHFPDGQMYVDLRGSDPPGVPVTPGAAVRRLLAACGLPSESIPDDLVDQSALYRSQLARRRILVVLDNARDVAQVRPLLPGGPGCLAIVTSRSALTGLIVAQGAVPLTLDTFADAEAREMLDTRLGARRTADEPEATAELIELSARLPLALAVIAARAATHSGYPLAAIALELKGAASRLDGLATGDAATDLRESLSWSYRQLSQTSARMFRSLGLHQGPEVSAGAAARLSGLPLAAARAALRELTDASLLAEPVPGRFTFHDLLRAYAAEQARASDLARWLHGWVSTQTPGSGQRRGQKGAAADEIGRVQPVAAGCEPAELSAKRRGGQREDAGTAGHTPEQRGRYRALAIRGDRDIPAAGRDADEGDSSQGYHILGGQAGNQQRRGLTRRGTDGDDAQAELATQERRGEAAADRADRHGGEQQCVPEIALLQHVPVVQDEDRLASAEGGVDDDDQQVGRSQESVPEQPVQAFDELVSEAAPLRDLFRPVTAADGPDQQRGGRERCRVARERNCMSYSKKKHANGHSDYGRTQDLRYLQAGVGPVERRRLEELRDYRQ
jgi:hypothetical protein